MNRDIDGRSASYYLTDGIDLRTNMEYMLHNYGHHILLRKNYQIHCTRYTEDIYKDGRTSCPYCMGTGKVNRIEKHLARKIFTVGDRSMFDSLADAPHSVTMVDFYKVYFHHYVMPNSQDIIYEVSWDEDNNVVALIAEYVIIRSVPMRGDRGRIEYWIAHVHTRPFGKQIRGAMIRKLSTDNIDLTYQDARVQYDLLWQT